MQYTKEDIEQLASKKRDIINDYRNKDLDFQNKTKGKFIQELAEIIDLEIELGLTQIEKSDISDYILNEIVLKNDFDINERTIQRNLKPEYKRNYSKSDTMSELKRDWTTLISDETTTVEKADNAIKINGVVYKKDTDEIKATESKKTSELGFVANALKYPETKQMLFDKMILQDAIKLIEKIMDRFFAVDKIDYDSKKLMGKDLKNEYDVDYIRSMPTMRERAVEDRELLKSIFKQNRFDENMKLKLKLTNFLEKFDERNTWTEYQKIMASVQMRLGHGIAEVAHIMGYSEKYGSIGLLRGYVFEKDDPHHQEFRNKLGTCPACKEWVLDAINTNIQEYELKQELDLEN